MDERATFVLECGWLPAAELDRLTAFAASELDGLSVAREQDPPARGVDPTIVVSVVSGVTTLLVPFLTKLAERLFRAEPTSRLRVEVSGGGEIVVQGGEAAEVRVARVEAAASAGIIRVRIEP